MPCVCTTETTNDTWFNQFVMLCDESAGPRQKQREGKRPRSDSVEDYKENLESTVFQHKKKKKEKKKFKFTKSRNIVTSL